MAAAIGVSQTRQMNDDVDALQDRLPSNDIGKIGDDDGVN